MVKWEQRVTWERRTSIERDKGTRQPVFPGNERGVVNRLGSAEPSHMSGGSGVGFRMVAVAKRRSTRRTKAPLGRDFWRGEMKKICISNELVSMSRRHKINLVGGLLELDCILIFE